MAPPISATPAPVRNSHCFRLRLAELVLRQHLGAFERALSALRTFSDVGARRELHKEERRLVVVGTEQLRARFRGV